jgi:Tfp pilus assembly protein PilZ
MGLGLIRQRSMRRLMKSARTESASERDQALKLFAEFRTLDRQRTRMGIRPLDYQRWLDLQHTLSQKYGKPVDFEGVTRLRVSYRTEDHLMDSVIPELGEGGLFVGTPFAPEVGERLILVIEVGQVEEFEMPCVVVGNNVSSGFTTARLGMSVEFQGLDEKQQIQAERIGARGSRA